MRRLTPAPKWAAAALALGILALAILAGLAARDLPGREIRTSPRVFDLEVLFLGRVMGYLLAFSLVLLAVLLLLPGGPPLRLPERRRMSPLKLLLGLVLLFGIFTALRPLTERLDEQLARATDETQPVDVEATGSAEPGSRWGLFALGGAVLLIVWGAAVATRQREEPQEEQPVSPPPATLSAIDELLAELEGSGDPRAVVIGAYARMELALTQDGLPRSPSEAPLEYLGRALDHLRVSRGAVEQLTRLFEIARFSNRRVAAGMGRQAVAALGLVRAELGGAVAR